MPKVTFECVFHPKNSSDITVFIPGWGYDGRLFDEWVNKTETSSLVVERYSPFDFVEDLHSELKKYSPEKIFLVGFSLGGFVAVDYAARYRADSVLLWSVRQAYPKSEIDFVRDQLEHGGVKAWEESHRFHAGKHRDSIKFLKEIKQNMVFPGKEILLEGLRYLETAFLSVDRLKPLFSVVFLHGSEDPLAPLSEVKFLSESGKNELKIIEGAPHLFRP